MLPRVPDELCDCDSLDVESSESRLDSAAPPRYRDTMLAAYVHEENVTRLFYNNNNKWSTYFHIAVTVFDGPEYVPTQLRIQRNRLLGVSIMDGNGNVNRMGYRQWNQQFTVRSAVGWFPFPRSPRHSFVGWCRRTMSQYSRRRQSGFRISVTTRKELSAFEAH